jgi:excisionase family DNA binding protein
MNEWMTTADASTLLKLSERRVREFARAGRIKAQKLDRDWLLDRAGVEEFAQQERRVGNPDWIAAGEKNETENR